MCSVSHRITNVTIAFQRGCDAYRIEVNMGDMILWRSDCAHSNAQPLLDREDKNRFRAVSYVCMLPADMTTTAALRRKAEGHRLRRTTSHWPNLETWFRERPREKAKWAQVKAQAQSEAQEKGGGQAKGQGAGVALEQAPPQLTQRQRELHGLTPYL
jgi:hypothetical protein